MCDGELPLSYTVARIPVPRGARVEREAYDIFAERLRNISPHSENDWRHAIVCMMTMYTPGDTLYDRADMIDLNKERIETLRLALASTGARNPLIDAHADKDEWGKRAWVWLGWWPVHAPSKL